MIGNIENIGANRIAKNLRTSTRTIAKVKSPRNSVTQLPDEYEDNDQDLKLEWQAEITRYAQQSLSLRETVKRFLDLGVSTDDLVEWTLELPGWTESTIRSVLSFVLRDHGIERHRKGQGRKTSAAAKADADQLIERFSDDYTAAAKHALAVYRQIKKLAKAAK